ncbi:MAG: hypothetical protein JKY61_05185 [Planctomycetes bacterium]|nr:hypothetical protein [Planctomycetota bacterium]
MARNGPLIATLWNVYPPESHETHFPVIDDVGLVGIFSLTNLGRIFLEEANTDMAS